MSAVKFQKGQEEWLMFMDYWNLCQKYWNVEKEDKYWETFMKDMDMFYNKYRHIELSKHIALAFINTQEEKHRKLIEN